MIYFNFRVKYIIPSFDCPEMFSFIKGDVQMLRFDIYQQNIWDVEFFAGNEKAFQGNFFKDNQV